MSSPSFSEQCRKDAIDVAVEALVVRRRRERAERAGRSDYGYEPFPVGGELARLRLEVIRSMAVARDPSLARIPSMLTSSTAGSKVRGSYQLSDALTRRLGLKPESQRLINRHLRTAKAGDVIRLADGSEIRVNEKGEGISISRSKSAPRRFADGSEIRTANVEFVAAPRKARR